VWLRSDADTLHDRLTHRGLPRDGEKLRRFAEFVAATMADTPPVVSHIVVDNRHNVREPLEAQVDRIVNG
jgi:hypothetical protein